MNHVAVASTLILGLMLAAASTFFTAVSADSHTTDLHKVVLHKSVSAHSKIHI